MNDIKILNHMKHLELDEIEEKILNEEDFCILFIDENEPNEIYEFFPTFHMSKKKFVKFLSKEKIKDYVCIIDKEIIQSKFNIKIPGYVVFDNGIISSIVSVEQIKNAIL